LLRYIFFPFLLIVGLWIFVTSLPQDVQIGLLLLCIFAFFLATLLTDVYPMARSFFPFAVAGICLLAGALGYYTFNPQAWFHGTWFQEIITTILRWNLLPEEFWRFATGFLAAIITGLIAWVGDHFTERHE
jgi:hypothetical protein